MIFFIGLFQGAHSFSHAFHIGDRELQNITHIFAIFLSLSIFYMLFKITNKLPSLLTIILIASLYLIDFYMVILKYPFIYTFFTQLIVFIVILLSFYKFLSKSVKNNIDIIFLLTLIISGFVLNEKINCEKMLNILPNFPFHIMVEITGFFIILTILKTFYRL